MNNIEIATKDLGKMNWYEAVEYCKKNTQWVLPTKEQLNYVYQNYFKNNQGNLKNDFYWTMDELSSQYAWSQNFNSGVFHYYTKMHKNNIRLIKNNGFQQLPSTEHRKFI